MVILALSASTSPTLRPRLKTCQRPSVPEICHNYLSSPPPLISQTHILLDTLQAPVIVPFWDILYYRYTYFQFWALIMSRTSAPRALEAWCCPGYGAKGDSGKMSRIGALAGAEIPNHASPIISGGPTIRSFVKRKHWFPQKVMLLSNWQGKSLGPGSNQCPAIVGNICHYILLAENVVKKVVSADLLSAVLGRRCVET